MDIPASSPEALSFTQSVRSEELPELIKHLRHFERMGQSSEVCQFDLILDANVVMPELRWAAMKRRNPAARSTLHELLECATVRAHAPEFLKMEVQANLPEIAVAENISLEKMQAHWLVLQRLIRFVDVGGPKGGEGVVDPKDAPYIRLQKLIEAPIASDDPHLPKMGADVIRVQLLAPLRAYSRHTAVEFKLKFAGLGSALLASLLLSALAGALVRTARNVPRPLVILTVVVLGLALLHPESRKKLFAIANQIMDGTAAAIGGCATILGPLLEEHAAAQQGAKTALAEAEALLPGRLHKTSAAQQPIARQPRRAATTRKSRTTRLRAQPAAVAQRGI